MAALKKNHWEDYAKKHLVGKKIVSIRWMYEDEVKAMGWHSRAIVMHLDDGSLLYPSRDDEGNDAGALFGQTKKGDDLGFPVR